MRSTIVMSCILPRSHNKAGNLTLRPERFPSWNGTGGVARNLPRCSRGHWIVATLREVPRFYRYASPRDEASGSPGHAWRTILEAWAAGKATPFLPGPSVNNLILQPARSSRASQGLETDHRKRSGLRADDVAH